MFNAAEKSYGLQMFIAQDVVERFIFEQGMSAMLSAPSQS
jgi:hypothetical protein